MLQTGNARHPFYAFKGCYSLHNIEIPWIGREYPIPILPQEEWGTSWRANRHTWHPSSSCIYKHPSQRNPTGSLSFPYHAPTMAGGHTLRPSEVLPVAASHSAQWPGPPLCDHGAWWCMTDPGCRRKCEITSTADVTWRHLRVKGNTIKNSWKKKIALIQGCSRSCKWCSDYTTVVY